MPKIIENVRELIVDKAYTLFIKEGYEQVKTSRIARECNIAAGTLFNYFPTKWDLLIEILAIIHQKNYEAFLEKLRESRSSYELLNHLIDNLCYLIERIGKLDKDFFADVMCYEGCGISRLSKSALVDEDKALKLLKEAFPQLRGQSQEVVWMVVRSLQAMVLATYSKDSEVLKRRKKFVCNSILAILDGIENSRENQEDK